MIQISGKTHIAAGLLSGIVVSQFTKTSNIDYIIYAGIGALLSDFDAQQSTISSMFPLVGKIVTAFSKHRGFFHILMPLLLFYTYWITKDYRFLFLSVGSASHYIIDILTSALGITCKSVGEGVICFALWMTIIGLCIPQSYWTVAKSEGTKFVIQIQSEGD